MKCEHPSCESPDQAVQPFTLTVFSFGAIQFFLCRLHRFQLMLACGMNREGAGV